MEDSDILRALLAQFFGRPADELIGKTDWDLMEPAAIEKFVADDRAVIQTGNPIIQEDLVQSVTGDQRLLSTRKIPIRDTDGWRVCSVSVDVTALKEQYEDRVQELIETKQLLIETDHASVLTMLSKGWFQ